jgi:VanZ family protein
MIAIATHRLERHARRILTFLLLIGVWSLALMIELGQTAMPDRAARFDNTVICAAGALLGWLATRRMLTGHDFAARLSRAPQQACLNERR